jgi:hypothetical protein
MKKPKFDGDDLNVKRKAVGKPTIREATDITFGCPFPPHFDGPPKPEPFGTATHAIDLVPDSVRGSPDKKVHMSSDFVDLVDDQFGNELHPGT